MRVEQASEIIINPYITEKTFELVETQARICFIVKRTSSKPAIKEAIKTLYDENAVNVNTASTVYGKKAYIEFETIDKARDKISNYAPTITTIQVHKDKIREVIGKGGAVIREITEKTGAKIEIDDKGLVSIAAVDGESGKAAVKWINEIVEEPEIGKIYEGKVVKLMDFGAFVNFMGSKDGLVHISQLKNERVEKVRDVVNEGDLVKVKVLDIDSRGKVKLSMKEVEVE